MPDDMWLYLTIALGVVVIALIVLLAMERERKKPLSKEPVKPARVEPEGRWPLTTARSVTENVISEAKDKLRILDLEREILSYAIRRLYEAHAEGKISEGERDNLAFKYKEDLSRIKEEISRGESILALNELERMQEEFVKLFSERFEMLNKRIEELRTVSGFAPPAELKTLEPERLLEEEEKKEEKAEVSLPQAEKAVAPKRKKLVSKPKTAEAPESAEQAESTEPEKSEAEKKVEQIVAEVEKVLQRLGQMEVEE